MCTKTNGLLASPPKASSEDLVLTKPAEFKALLVRLMINLDDKN